MGMGRVWSQEELRQLEEEWGVLSVPGIAKKHNRTEEAIKIKANRLHLGPHLDSSDLIPFNQIMLAFGVDAYCYELERMKKAGLKIHYKRVSKKRYRMVDIDEFWEFARKNQTLFNFSKLEKNALGVEPDWVDAARREDYLTSTIIKPKNSPWTKADEAELIRLTKMHRYSYSDIAKRLGRSEGAIHKRLVTIGIKDRPLKADNHTKWTEEEFRIMCEMIKRGSNYVNIRAAIGKSTKAIQGRVYAMYLTEKLDKVREIIGDGEWGDNRPVRLIKHINAMEYKEKKATRKDLSLLAGIFKCRCECLQKIENEIGWQHKQCQHWKGSCLKGQTNCDECTQFRRKDCYD